MRIVLTSQEKKVLGFIALMTLLGFFMLIFNKCSAPAAENENRSSKGIAP